VEKIGPLPSLAPGETLYSWGAKTHALWGWSARQTSLALFGTLRTSHSHAIPPGLTYLARATADALGPSRALLAERTVLAAYLPFVAAEKRWQIEQAFLDGQASRARMLLGMRSTKTNVTHAPRYCETCAQEDRSELGYSRWLVKHQLPGSWLCRVHQRPLSFAVGPLSWALPFRVGSSTFSISDGDLQAASRCAMVADELLKLKQVNVHALRQALLKRLSVRGLAPNPDRLNAESLHRAFKATSMSTLLPATEPGACWWESPAWIHKSLSSHHPSQPIKWIALWSWLHDDVEPEICARAFFLAATETRENAASAQMELWDASARPGSVESTARVCDAMACSRTLEEVHARLGVGRRVLIRWMQEVPALSQRWTVRKLEFRGQLALATVDAYLREHPGAWKKDVKNACTADIRWLERHDTVALAELLRRIPATRSPQQHLVMDPPS